MSIFGSIADAFSGLAPIAGQVLDPLNITGVNSDRPPSANSQVANNWSQRHADRQLQQQQAQWQTQEDQRVNDAAWEERKGFLTSMMPPQAAPQVPQGGWSYQPGKGATWMAPSQPSAGQPEAPSQQPAWAATPGNSPFKGNRI